MVSVIREVFSSLYTNFSNFRKRPREEDLGEEAQLPGYISHKHSRLNFHTFKDRNPCSLQGIPCSTSKMASKNEKKNAKNLPVLYVKRNQEMSSKKTTTSRPPIQIVELDDDIVKSDLSVIYDSRKDMPSTSTIDKNDAKKSLDKSGIVSNWYKPKQRQERHFTAAPHNIFSRTTKSFFNMDFKNRYSNADKKQYSDLIKSILNESHVELKSPRSKLGLPNKQPIQPPKAIEVVDISREDNEIETSYFIHPTVGEYKENKAKIFPKPNKDDYIPARIKKINETVQKDVANYLDRINKNKQDLKPLYEKDAMLEEQRKKFTEDDAVARLQRQVQIFDLSQAERETELIEEREEDQFPPLSDEAQEMVARAFGNFPNNEVLVNFFGRNLTRHDIKTLSGRSWLNDEVINAYMDLIVERGKTEDYPSVYAFNTIFYAKITRGGGHAVVKRWTRKVDIFKHQYLIVPVHLDVHWCMMVVNFKDKSITYYDSMLHPNMPALQAMKNYLIAEKLDKKQEKFDMSDWKLLSPRDIPQQENSFDCGVFASIFAETVTRQKPIKFTQTHMPYFRKRMAYEIMSLKLML